MCFKFTHLVWTYVLFVRDSAVIKSHVCSCVCDCVPFLLPVHPLGVTMSDPNPPPSLHMPVSSDSPPRPIGRCLYRRVIWRVARYHIPIVLCVCVFMCVCCTCVCFAYMLVSKGMRMRGCKRCVQACVCKRHVSKRHVSRACMCTWTEYDTQHKHTHRHTRHVPTTHRPVME